MFSANTRDDLFTVWGVCVSFIQPRKCVTARIVGYRSAREEDSGSGVKRQSAHNAAERQSTKEGSLAPADSTQPMHLVL
jgi:hypothetical protein